MIVPVRATPVLAAAVKETVPLPEPLPPELIVIQGTLLTAVKVQIAVVVMVKLPVPPAAPMLVLVGLIVYEQPDD